MDKNNTIALPTVPDPRFKMCVFSKSGSESVAVRQVRIKSYQQPVKMNDTVI